MLRLGYLHVAVIVLSVATSRHSPLPTAAVDVAPTRACDINPVLKESQQLGELLVLLCVSVHGCCLWRVGVCVVVCWEVFGLFSWRVPSSSLQPAWVAESRTGSAGLQQ